MTIAKPDDRVPTCLLFVDGTNLDHRLREAFGRVDVDLKKLFEELGKGCRLIHVHYFTAPYTRSAETEMHTNQTKALNFLRTLTEVTIHLGRHQPRTIRCRRPNCSYTYTSYDEKGTDVHAAARLVQSACHKLADRLILVTNDNDFVPAVQICKAEGAQVDIAYVLSSREPFGAQRYRLDSLRKLAGKTTEMTEEWMSGLWKPPKIS